MKKVFLWKLFSEKWTGTFHCSISWKGWKTGAFVAGSKETSLLYLEFN